VIKSVEMVFEFKNTIPRAPQAPQEMYSQACSNDNVTVNTWRPIWIANVKANKERFKSFAENGLGKLFGQNKYKPAIVCGSGPSLKNNLEFLKKVPKGIPIISCLHNYQFMEDNGIEVDYYVSLDAGDIVVEEISEGGGKTHQDYVELTGKRKLIAFIGTSPKLFDNWKGEVYLYNSPVPDDEYRKEVEAVEPFHTLVSTGGNVLGASNLHR
jgi:hypothetical protein